MLVPCLAGMEDGRQLLAVLVGLELEDDAELAEIRSATRLPGTLARTAHGRQQETRQDSDDRDDHEQLNKREALA